MIDADSARAVGVQRTELFLEAQDLVTRLPQSRLAGRIHRVAATMNAFGADGHERPEASRVAIATDAWFAAGELFDKRLKDKARARAECSHVPPPSPHYAEPQKRSSP
jgi:hypothetical protein